MSPLHAGSRLDQSNSKAVSGTSLNALLGYIGGQDGPRKTGTNNRYVVGLISHLSYS